jgi:hypothetical protein
MNKYYKVNYQDGIWLSKIFGNKEKAEKFKQEQEKANISEVEIKGYFKLVTLGASSVYTSIERDDFICLGDLRDVKCSYDCTGFCLPQYQEEGKKAFEEELERRAKRSDSYYSRPWV